MRVFIRAVSVAFLLTGCQAVPAGRTTGVSLAPPAAAAVFGEAVKVTGHPDPLALLDVGTPEQVRNKHLVFDFWRSIVNGGQVELADTMQLAGYIQHSPVLPTGREAFKQIFSVVPRLDPVPELVSPPLVSIIAEGDLVVMSLVETLQEPDGSGTYTSTHFNLFRIEDGRLAEHWHSVQTPPGPAVALPENGGPQPVTGASGLDQLALLDAADATLAANKRLVFDLWRQVIEAGHEELADIYLAQNYIQHNPNAATGREGFKAYFSTRDDLPIASTIKDDVVAIVAEGDLVVLALRREYPHPVHAGRIYTTTWFGMFRVAGNRLVEHWDEATR